MKGGGGDKVQVCKKNTLNKTLRKINDSKANTADEIEVEIIIDLLLWKVEGTDSKSTVQFCALEAMKSCSHI